jgi:hypothetical protein
LLRDREKLTTQLICLLVLITLPINADQTVSRPLLDPQTSLITLSHFLETFDSLVVDFDLSIPPSSVEKAFPFILNHPFVAGQTYG